MGSYERVRKMFYLLIYLLFSSTEGHTVEAQSGLEVLQSNSYLDEALYLDAAQDRNNPVDLSDLPKSKIKKLSDLILQISRDLYSQNHKQRQEFITFYRQYVDKFREDGFPGDFGDSIALENIECRLSFMRSIVPVFKELEPDDRSKFMDFCWDYAGTALLDQAIELCIPIFKELKPEDRQAFRKFIRNLGDCMREGSKQMFGVWDDVALETPSFLVFKELKPEDREKFITDCGSYYASYWKQFPNNAFSDAIDSLRVVFTEFKK